VQAERDEGAEQAELVLERRLEEEERHEHHEEAAAAERDEHARDDAQNGEYAIAERSCARRARIYAAAPRPQSPRAPHRRGGADGATRRDQSARRSWRLVRPIAEIELIVLLRFT